MASSFKGLKIPQEMGEPVRIAPDGGLFVTISHAGVKAEGEPVEPVETRRKALVRLNRKIKEYVEWKQASLKSPRLVWRSKPEAIDAGGGQFIAIARLRVCEQ